MNIDREVLRSAIHFPFWDVQSLDVRIRRNGNLVITGFETKHKLKITLEWDSKTDFERHIENVKYTKNELLQMQRL